MPSLTLVCIHANVLIVVYHLFPSEVSGQFIGTMDTTGGGSGGDGGATNFGTFLFCTTGSGILIAFGD